ncbi:MAG: hypothetical protein BWY07_00612 [Candidatus Hydrogenedentes bacterium ADurb.Bin170]|jgi:hypothetical protein|nr:MAG: hypothetical protein BWY07_00612 [Candidatus Hydrogenedentes bacterium ADurb.Bin170]
MMSASVLFAQPCPDEGLESLFLAAEQIQERMGIPLCSGGFIGILSFMLYIQYIVVFALRYT